MRKVTRRGFCHLGLVGVSSSLAGCSKLPEPEPNPLQIDITQSTRMADAATTAGQDKTHALDVIERALEVSIGDLAERADGFGAVEVTRNDEPIDTSSSYGPAQSLYRHKKTHAAGQTVDKEIHSALLVDAGPMPSFSGAGIAEDHGGDRLCPLKEDAMDGSTYSAIMNGGSLLSLDPDDVQLDEPSAGGTESAYGALAMAVHEVGHNLCLHHSHGRLTRDDEGVVVTPMGVGYSLELAGTETVCGDTNAEITTESPENREVQGINNETVTFRNFNEEATPAEPVRLTLRFSDCAVAQI